jgi:hypothetical protein
MVDAIAARKAAMIADAICFAVLLLVGAGVVVAVGDGNWLTSRIAEIGGYVAIIAVVLGLPALGYAMVTDHNVDVLSAALLESISEKIGDLLRKAPQDLLPADHHVQLWRPNPDRTLLLPVYDPHHDGPREGWGIDPASPQAVTGSAWVRNEYFYLRDPGLHDSTLRLTRRQRRRFRDLTGVAATPVRDASQQPIAVLTILTSSLHPRIGDHEFINLHVALAEHLAEILQPATLDLPSMVPSNAGDVAGGAIELTPQVIAEAVEQTPELADFDADSDLPSSEDD